MKVGEVTIKAPKILLYGDVGTGKTALALTAGERAQVIDLDDGLMTGVTLQDQFTAERKKVDAYSYVEPEPQKKAVVFHQVKQKIIGIANDCVRKVYPYDLLIVDSLSALAESAVAQIMTNSGKFGQAPEIQHWGLAFLEIKSVMSVIRSMPIPVILIAHEQTKSIGKGMDKDEKLQIAVAGKNLPSEIARYFDEIWYMRVADGPQNKKLRRIQTVADEKRLARSRFNVPDMTDVSCGMWELLKKCGYTPPERKSNVQTAAATK